MKRIVIAVGLIMLLLAVSGAAQTPAPKPGPEHKKLMIWVGEWSAASRVRHRMKVVNVRSHLVTFAPFSRRAAPASC